MKKLSEMTLEELWKLFPITLTEPNPCWKGWYLEEERALKTALSRKEKIHHIGSTAVGTIWAKPILDILLEVPVGSDLSAYKTQITGLGYLCMAESEKGLSFNKGYTEQGFAERVFHLHLRYAGDNAELYFRDYLIDHADTAQAYERLKLSLWKEYEFDRDGYTNAKTEFVQTYTQAGMRLYGNRYGCKFNPA